MLSRWFLALLLFMAELVAADINRIILLSVLRFPDFGPCLPEERNIHWH